MNKPALAAVAPAAREQTAPVLIRAEKASKIYTMGDQTVRALDGVDLEIAEGDFVAIMGASGSGKSTMMNLIGALDVPTTGALYIDGRDISKMSADDLADLRNRRIGFVFQQFNLLARTPALRQVMLPLLYSHPRPADPERMARERLEQVGLGDAARPPSASALGRPAAARRHRACARQQSQDPSGRRADRRARHQDVGRDHGAVCEAQRRGHYGHHRHARA